MSNLSIVFVPGSYSPLSAYQSLLEGVSNAGYAINGIHLPTVGPASRQGQNHPAPSMYGDAAAIAEEVERLADQGDDVILLGHSYSGIPISQCTKGLGKAERTAQGKPGGVVHLAYMACLVPAPGQSAVSLLSGLPGEIRPPVHIDEHGWMLLEDPAATARLVCQQLPPHEGEAVIRSFAKHSAQSFGDVLTHAGFKHIPSSYLLCEKDLAGPPPFQRAMIAMIEAVSGRPVDVTSIEADHFPHLTAEMETIEWVSKVARKAQEGSVACT